MPLVKISLARTRPAAQARAIADGVHRALAETFAVPPEDRFQLVQRFDAADLVFDRAYLGIARTDGFVLVEIVASAWRDVGQKKALYAAIVRNLAADPGLRPEDVMIVLVPNAREDWSFGLGRASYVPDDAPTDAVSGR